MSLKDDALKMARYILDSTMSAGMYTSVEEFEAANLPVDMDQIEVAEIVYRLLGHD